MQHAKDVMKMPTTYTNTCIRQYCGYHTEWPKQAFLLAQFQGVQKGHVDVSQDTVGVPPRGPGAREGAGAGPLQDFLPDED